MGDDGMSEMWSGALGGQAVLLAEVAHVLVEVAACVGHVGLVGQPHLLDVHLDAQRRIGHVAHTGTDAVDRSHVASIEGIACWQAHECRHAVAVASIAIAAVAVEAGYEPRAGAGDGRGLYHPGAGHRRHEHPSHTSCAEGHRA